MSKVSIKTLLASAVLFAAVPAMAADGAFGRCELRADTAKHALTPAQEGVLTIAVPLPSPQAYQGNTPETIDGGYLYCLGAEIANRGGLGKIVVKNASFESLVTGKGTDFDMSIWDLFPTDERKKAVDFSGSYRFTDTGVIAKAGSEVTADTLGAQRIGVLLGSVQEKFVREKLKLTGDLRIFQSNDDMWAALMANQIDAALADTETALPRATASNGALKVFGRYPVGGDVAILFPKGSKNVAPTDAILADMRADRSLEGIEVKWLAPILGAPVSTIAEWSTE
ncbi:transporter substrate-binding domain-containing protein [Pararhizobium sp. YC-54]|uniref:transporter substrate-binding domain-containing protein n=1 Tax=Pararhizobium sp. YC-54 TaxID=2986920 RepID=UPI0021F74EDF|nr:transporter substrate-binding domain-containing protein [Pararhizobium sp. YC-54]MCW0001087.1 transporter substrate-binding domain-containing protein [Pararhizobium sp. YC-54]